MCTGTFAAMCIRHWKNCLIFSFQVWNLGDMKVKHLCIDEKSLNILKG